MYNNSDKKPAILDEMLRTIEFEFRIRINDSFSIFSNVLRSGLLDLNQYKNRSDLKVKIVFL